MALELVTAPTDEPIKLNEAKAFLHYWESDQDAEIIGAIKDARNYVETWTEKQLVTATWKLYLDAFPAASDSIDVPLPPLKLVNSIKYIDTAGVEQTWASSKYKSDTATKPGLPPPLTRPPYSMGLIGAECRRSESGSSPSEGVGPPLVTELITVGM